MKFDLAAYEARLAGMPAEDPAAQYIRDNNEKLKKAPDGSCCTVCRVFVPWGSGSTGKDGRIHTVCM